MSNSPVRVHFDMQCVGLHVGMAVYETELALRLMKYDDLDITASYFLPTGDDRDVSQFSFPVKRVKVPTTLVYHALPVGKRKLLHAIEKPIFWAMRPFVSYDSLVKNTGRNVYVFFENRIPVIPVNGKVIAVIHDVRSLRFQEANRNRETNTRINTREILKRADAIITVSEFTRREVVDIFHADPDRIEVIYSNIGASMFAKDIDVSKYDLPEKYILYFGSCDLHKNVPALVNAYALLTRELRDEYKLVITNPNDTIKDLVHEHGLTERVQYLHRVPEPDKPGIYRNASLCVWPSMYEGFGLPVLEAQASGCPVVCSNAASMPEVAGDAAILFDPLDTQAIADAITRVLTNDTLRRELITKGYENVKRFSWDDSARKLHDIITNL